jgi:hypothetical protein
MNLCLAIKKTENGSVFHDPPPLPLTSFKMAILTSNIRLLLCTYKRKKGERPRGSGGSARWVPSDLLLGFVVVVVVVAWTWTSDSRLHAVSRTVLVLILNGTAIGHCRYYSPTMLMGHGTWDLVETSNTRWHFSLFVVSEETPKLVQWYCSEA